MLRLNSLAKMCIMCFTPSKANLWPQPCLVSEELMGTLSQASPNAEQQRKQLQTLSFSHYTEQRLQREQCLSCCLILRGQQSQQSGSGCTCPILSLACVTLKTSINQIIFMQSVCTQLQLIHLDLEAFQKQDCFQASVSASLRHKTFNFRQKKLGEG